MLKLIVIVTIAMSTFSCSATQWRIWHKSDDLKIAFMPHESGINYVKVNAFYAGGSVDSLLNIMNDTKSTPQWLSSVSYVEVLARPNLAQAVVYTYFDSPWPVSNRDMVTHSCLSQLSDTQFRLDIVNSSLEGPKSKAIRVEPVRGYWLLTQTELGLNIEHHIYADPNGAIPHWLANKTALKNIRSSFIALKELISDAKYQSSPSAFVAGNCEAFNELKVQ
ncbi:START domain-containing protein [Pseudoalteromonas sp. MMG022]|uniref:START domain-containing protein n=1 Tax=Pseudoalteromonas sp. MMG022 TaxID=2909978 RepID=UPI001F02746D|nr:START domain-containing protein [Pseudoalteromonas sp. MMG022]MCF6435901.1 START domain-containing protein [Pseudoalteromonas sp. MMG022]